MMLNNITRDFIKKGYFDTLSQISIDDSDQNKPISFFQSSQKYINFDGKVVKNLFKEKELKGCDLGRIPIFRVFYINFSVWSTTNYGDKRIKTLQFGRVQL
jgi:hypothetical protein